MLPGPGTSSLAVLVVGMHRSGTSAFSGVLANFGVATPEDLAPGDIANERGYFEPKRIVDFHDRLLEQLGSSWSDPLPLAYDWVQSPTGRAASSALADILADEFGQNPMCLFKDPRLCRLLPVWNAALSMSGRAAVAILPYRHPLEVAGSLGKRDHFGRPYALFMWLQHVLLAERFTRRMARSFADYQALLDDWRTVVAKVQRELKVAWPRDLARAAPDVDAFLGKELRHHAAATTAIDAHDGLDGLCQRVWTGLQRFNADPYDRAAMAEFDAVWAEFDAARAIFAPLVIEYQRTRAAISDERDLLRESRDEAVEAHEKAFARALELDQEVHRRDEDVRASHKREAEAAAQMAELWREIGNLSQEVERRGQEIERRDVELERLRPIETSTFWAISFPLRRALVKHPWLRRNGRRALKLLWWTATFQLLRKLRPARGPAAPLVASEQGEAHHRKSGAAGARILFVSGEAHTPGHNYRVVRLAQAAARSGAQVTLMKVEDLPDRMSLGDADLVFIWRTTWSKPVGALLLAAKEAGAPVVFDIDDLAFDPSLARTEIIDGIRSQGFTEEGTADHFRRTREVLAHADICTAPTLFLGDRLRECGKPTFLLPNTFDEEVLQRSRLAVRRRRSLPSDGLLRIGYATGSKTHQADFARCAAAVAEVLRTHPQARLVLFGWGDVPAETQMLHVSEFPELAGLEGQIEWRKMVPLAELPDELARFDICIAPLEAGNPFCEAKSELKYFEAALVDVPTIASPTEPYRLAIRDGETGFLAADPQAWREALTRLVDDPDLRRRVARAAFYDSLAAFGPERCDDAVYSLIEQTLADGRRAGRAFELELARRDRRAASPPQVPDHEIVFVHDALRTADVTVVIPLHNYAGVIGEALDSVHAQTEADLDLIVVDDCSTDDSFAVARAWLEQHAERFNRVLLIRNRKNAGLGFTRNVGFANAETPYVLPLDADNRLRPECVARTLAEIKRTHAAFAYPGIQEFEDSGDEANTQAWLAARLVAGNYIDAMALVRRSAWAMVGGYDHVRHGWEDYDLWCRLVEQGMFGVRAPALLAEYRVHGRSMLRTQTDLLKNKLDLIADMERRHPWLRLNRPPEAREPGAREPGA